MLRLVRLRLQDFRTYERLNWELEETEAGRVVVVTGPNGSGKTNLLEAVSLLVPGRGLRGARSRDFPRRTATGSVERWGIAARLLGPTGIVDLGTGAELGTGERRDFRLDGVRPRSQADIIARIGLVWLTPQMDALFQEPASGRRRFLDRLVFALEPAHARQIAAHDTAHAQRLRLLTSGRFDHGWLAGLEDAIARHAVCVTAARLSLVRSLNQALRDGVAAGFPPAVIGLACPIAARLTQGSALAAEDWLRVALDRDRAEDARIGSARHGAQRADMTLADFATGRAADLASTGECKALLLGVVLGHAALIGTMRGVAPILLLDEPMVHLDAERRSLLCGAARAIQAQFLLTGTDPESFAALRGTAGFFRAQNGTLQR